MSVNVVDAKQQETWRGPRDTLGFVYGPTYGLYPLDTGGPLTKTVVSSPRE